MKTAATDPGELPPGYKQLRTRLGQIGWVALGSVLERAQSGQGGPRYQWSRRVQGKTITVALSAEQFAWLKTAIKTQREVWELLSKMHQLILSRVQDETNNNMELNSELSHVVLTVST